MEQTTSNQLLADGWRLTRAILALKGLQIPHTIEFRIDSATHIRATRTATLDELANAVTALDEAIERRSQNRPNVTDLHSHLKIEDLNKQRDALAELQKRAGLSGSPASTTVIEALFPTFPPRRERRRRRQRSSDGLLSEKRKASRSTRRPLKSTGTMGKPWTRTACTMNGNCPKSSIRSVANISPTPLEATFGFGSAIFPNRLSKGCSKEENQHSSRSGRFIDE